MKQGHILIYKPIDAIAWRSNHVILEYHRSPSNEKCAERLPDRYIKSIGGILRNDTSTTYGKIGNFAEHVIHHSSMLDHCSFRRSGGTGGVNYVGQTGRLIT